MEQKRSMVFYFPKVPDPIDIPHLLDANSWWDSVPVSRCSGTGPLSILPVTKHPELYPKNGTANTFSLTPP